MIQILDIDESSAFNAPHEKATGTNAVIIKGGQGMLAYNCQPLIDQCKAAGLPYGIYWLVDARYHSTDHFTAIQKAFPTKDFGQLGLWLDWENPNPSLYPKNSDYNKLPYAGYRDCSGLITLLKGWTSNLKGLYTGLGFWNDRAVPNGDPAAQGTAEWFAAQCMLWFARYTYAEVTDPGKLGAWNKWTLWQYQEGPDFSTFNGTDDEFNQLFGLTSAPPPVLISPPGTITTAIVTKQIQIAVTSIDPNPKIEIL